MAAGKLMYITCQVLFFAFAFARKGNNINSVRQECQSTDFVVNYNNDQYVCGQHSEKCIPLNFFKKHTDPPTVAYPAAQHGSLYTLIMLDPDAPQPGLGSNWLHWIVPNIDGDSLSRGIQEWSMRQTEKYAPPTPPPPAPHHYQFFLYLQTKEIHPEKPKARLNFDIQGFKEKYNLNEVHWTQFKTQNTGK